jgi:hypothetical protein
MMRSFAAAAPLAASLLACSNGGFRRGLFFGKVIDRTPEQVVGAFVKPESSDSSVPDVPKYVYALKTFNPDNMIKVDDKTVVEFAKNRAGQVVCTDVSVL